MEPIRPHVDAFVLSVFRDRTLRPKHFRRVGAACLLGKTGRGRFYEAFEPRGRALARLLGRSCRTFVCELRGRVEAPR